MFQENKSCVLVSDFDGTATLKDFFYLVIEEILDEEGIKPWNDYQKGKITHFEALNRIFQNLNLDIEEFHELILSIPVDNCFVQTVNFCEDKNIPVYIISAGADYYINFILDYLGIKNSISLIANESMYSPETGLVMTKPGEDSVFYSENYGIDKEKALQVLKHKYQKVIFAGDGTPDYYAARHADKVFARGTLLENCKENNLEAEKMESYCQILDYLKNFISSDYKNEK